MKKLLAIAMTGIFALSLHGPVRAQKEVAPPPISPLLEGQKPLQNAETAKDPAAPQKSETKKAKPKAGKSSKKNSKSSKSGVTKKKQAGKKSQAVAKKKNQKAGQKTGGQKTSKKKRPAEPRQPAGPDEG
ncbi:MAG: hypothetical protein C4567_18560 [Deltaproteobacteria bacterium]|nr:MAG: hypothetical protein C4567_18560 [Deltaproteobacteria bacterium]